MARASVGANVMHPVSWGGGGGHMNGTDPGAIMGSSWKESANKFYPE